MKNLLSETLCVCPAHFEEMRPVLMKFGKMTGVITLVEASEENVSLRFVASDSESLSLFTRLASGRHHLVPSEVAFNKVDILKIEGVPL